MGGAVIDLGLAEPWEPEPEPPPRWPPSLPTWLVPALVAAATLLTLGAAATPRRWDPVLVQQDQNTALHFGPGDTAYLTTQRARSARLQVYRPDRKGPLWSVNFPGGYPIPVFGDDPALLTVIVHDADPSGELAGDAVQGRDPRTGRIVWTRPGTGLLGIDDDTAVVTNRQEGGGPLPGPAADLRSVSGVVAINPVDGSVVAMPAMPAGRVEGVDRRTGASRWSREVAPDVLLGNEVVPEGRAPQVIELTADGRLRLIDPATGAVRHETRLALVGRPLDVTVTGAGADGRVVVHQQTPDGEPPVSMEYDLATGATTRPLGDGFDAGACGGKYLCLAGPETLTVTDRATGAVRYQGRSNMHVIDGDRLLVSWDGAHPRPAGTQLYDLRTGRQSHEYAGWFLASYEFGSSLLVQQMAGRTLLVSRVVHATGAITVIGRATDWTGSATCTSGVRYVGCVGASGVRIWRLPRDT